MVINPEITVSMLDYLIKDNRIRLHPGYADSVLYPQIQDPRLDEIGATLLDAPFTYELINSLHEQYIRFCYMLVVDHHYFLPQLLELSQIMGLPVYTPSGVNHHVSGYLGGHHGSLSNIYFTLDDHLPYGLRVHRKALP